MARTPARCIAVGTSGQWPLTRTLKFAVSDVCEHTHVIGLSKSGKSRWLVGYYLSLLEHGCPVTLLDPHGTTAQLVLSHLVARGYFRKKDAFRRVRFLDFPAADQQGRYLPLNVLASHGSSHTVAANVLEAFHRAWPKLADGDAPRFDKLVLNGVKVLQSNGLPLPLLTTFLTNRDFRTRLLANEPDQVVVAVWQDWYDQLSEKLRLDYSDSTLTRLNLITFNPVLKYSLGQVDNALPLRQLMDEGVSLIVNLALLDEDTRRLLGCLLTVGFEQAALL